MECAVQKQYQFYLKFICSSFLGAMVAYGIVTDIEMHSTAFMKEALSKSSSSEFRLDNAFDRVLASEAKFNRYFPVNENNESLINSTWKAIKTYKVRETQNKASVKTSLVTNQGLPAIQLDSDGNETDLSDLLFKGTDEFDLELIKVGIAKANREERLEFSIVSVKQLGNTYDLTLVKKIGLDKVYIEARKIVADNKPVKQFVPINNITDEVKTVQSSSLSNESSASPALIKERETEFVPSHVQNYKVFQEEVKDRKGKVVLKAGYKPYNNNGLVGLRGEASVDGNSTIFWEKNNKLIQSFEISINVPGKEPFNISFSEAQIKDGNIFNAEYGNIDGQETKISGNIEQNSEGYVVRFLYPTSIQQVIVNLITEDERAEREYNISNNVSNNLADGIGAEAQKENLQSETYQDDEEAPPLDDSNNDQYEKEDELAIRDERLQATRQFSSTPDDLLYPDDLMDESELPPEGEEYYDRDIQAGKIEDEGFNPSNRSEKR